MNLILVFPSDFIDAHRVRLTDQRRCGHITDVLRAKSGDRLCVGMCNGNMGEGTIAAMEDGITLDVRLDQPPPDPLPLTLVVALPRPQAFKRTLICAASLGIKKIIVLQFNRVEKSLWQSSALQPGVMGESLVLGLEQARDTRLPEVVLKKKFKPFVEDELPLIMEGGRALVAHPSGPSAPVQRLKQGDPVTLIIGPEGGIVDYELGLLTAAGAQPFSLGPRILKVESVLPYIIGAWFGA